LPEDKPRAVERLSANSTMVGTVGDGINDSPALARAHIGFAMGAMGTDAATASGKPSGNLIIVGVKVVWNLEDTLGHANTTLSGRSWSERHEARDWLTTASNDDFGFPPEFDVLNQARQGRLGFQHVHLVHGASCVSVLSWSSECLESCARTDTNGMCCA